MGTALTLTALPATRTTAPPAPATALVARSQGPGLPSYVTQEQARAIIDQAANTRDRLLAEALWQSGGRVSEVARLRRCDLEPAEGALRLTNLKQRRTDRRRKLVYVSPGLVAALLAYCNDARIAPTGPVFASRQGGHGAITRQQVYNVVTALSREAGVTVVGRDGQLRLATGLDFRHGAAVHQLRAGVPLSEVSQQLGHARLDTTAVYVRLTNAERRRYADRVAW